MAVKHTYNTIIREGKMLKVIYAERARLRQLSTLKQNVVNDTVPTTLEERKEDLSVLEPVKSEAIKNETLSKVAEDVGMKRTTYTKTEELVDKAVEGYLC